MGKILSWFKRLYEGLRIFFWPVCKKLFPRYIKIGHRKFLFATANRITIARTILLVPFAFIFVWNKQLALGIFISSVVFDFADGLVAKIHKKQGFEDDEDLGAFLDAFLDKVFWVGTCLIVLASHDYQNFSILLNVGVYTIPSVLIIIEIVLGKIRLEDFFSNRWKKKLNFVEIHKDLKAKPSGKLKMLLECLGLIFLILETYYLGIICLVLAVPFGIKSVLDKIK